MGSRLGRRFVHSANLPIKLLMPNFFTNIKEVALNHTISFQKRGGLFIAKPDYEKAYVTLKNPLLISPNLYPIRIIDKDKKQSKSSIVEEGEARRHWLDEEGERFILKKAASSQRRGSCGHGAAKFPWSSMMRSGSAR